jgi:phosphohistidine phosphatase
MRLYLVRHGIATSRTDPQCPSDPKRPLTPEGIKKTRAAMLGLRALGVEPEEMLTSSYLRAVQTAEIAADALGFPPEKVRRSDSLLPGAGPSQLVRELEKLSREQVICFGHAPHLDLVIAHCLGQRAPVTALRKGGAARLDLETLSPVRAELAWLMTAKALRLIGEA